MRVLCLCVVGLLSFVLCGAEIYYPGTFDPFHNTHVNEVVEAQNNVVGAHVTIAPIERAYYNILSDGTKRPSFLDYETNILLIERSFRLYPGVATSHRLRHLDRHVFEALQELASESKDPEKYLLVGADVLDLWKDMPGFDALRRCYRFIISRDARNKAQTAKLEDQFRLDASFAFITADTLALRSTFVLTRLFNDEYLDDIVPAAFAEYFSDVTQTRHALRRFWDDCVTFAHNLAMLELSARLGPLCEAEKQQVRVLVRAYLASSETHVSGRIKDTFDKLVGDSFNQAPYLRSTLRLYQGWAKRNRLAS